MFKRKNQWQILIKSGFGLAVLILVLMVFGIFQADSSDPCPAAIIEDLFNGTGQGFDGGSQANGGVDDYNNGGSAPTDRYEGTWTDCSSGDHCGTGLSSADAKDENTGLIWSLPCNGSGCLSFSDSSPIQYTWDNSGANNNSQTASQLCSAGSHGESGWSLPHQKQLMQAYIDGAYKNLEASGRYLWSATTVSGTTTSAWIICVSRGSTFYNGKDMNNTYVRCVRPAP